MTLDRDTLAEAHCWFSVDKVPDPEMTAFKREARYRQAMWRETKGYPRGTHNNSRSGVAAGGPPTLPNGSRLEDDGTGRNFLSEVIHGVAEDRISRPQKYQTLNPTRLRTDLLSSMPMCFNLFGSLRGDSERARATAAFLFPEVGHGRVDVTFEWSPGRADARYTNDRTAFDAALLVGDQSPRCIIGVETKYHEHALPEKKPKPNQVGRHTAQRQHYSSIARSRPDVFKPGWEQLLGTELEQIWRDHLLLLSMLHHADEWGAGRYVLIYPSRNVSYAAAAQAYQMLLREDDTTFRAITLDKLVAADVLFDDNLKALFTERYMWWL